MSKVNLLQGEACHLEFLHMEEGESKRHRARCIYFNKKNEYCSAFCGKCRGSSHCDKYSERLVTEKSHESKRILDSELKAFSGIKVIPMSDIVIHKNFDIPTRKKLQEQIDYYNKHGNFDKPIVVDIIRNKYVLVDKYLRYYAAKQLGLSSISAEMMSCDKQLLRDKLRNKGTLVWSNIHSDVGEVIGYTIDKVSIKLDNGKCVDFNIHQCLEKKALEIL